MKMREKRKKWSLMGIPPLIGCGRCQRRLLLPQHATFMFSSISTCTFVTYTFTFVFAFTTDYSILNTHHTPFSILLSQHSLSSWHNFAIDRTYVDKTVPSNAKGVTSKLLLHPNHDHWSLTSYWLNFKKIKYVHCIIYTVYSQNAILAKTKLRF